jgi:hypothetical protein
MKQQIVRMLQLVVGFFLTLYFYESGFDGVWDGPCSGLRGYESHCYTISITKLSVLYVIIPSVASYWIKLNWFFIGALFAVVATYLFFLIGAGEHFFFSNQPYMPTLFGVWVGLYVLTVGIVFNAFWHKLKSGKVI